MKKKKGQLSLGKTADNNRFLVKKYQPDPFSQKRHEYRILVYKMWHSKHKEPIL